MSEVTLYQEKLKSVSICGLLHATRHSTAQTSGVLHISDRFRAAPNLLMNLQIYKHGFTSTQLPQHSAASQNHSTQLQISKPFTTVQKPTHAPQREPEESGEREREREHTRNREKERAREAEMDTVSQPRADRERGERGEGSRERESQPRAER